MLFTEKLTDEIVYKLFKVYKMLHEFENFQKLNEKFSEYK